MMGHGRCYVARLQMESCGNKRHGHCYVARLHREPSGKKMQLGRGGVVQQLGHVVQQEAGQVGCGGVVQQLVLQTQEEPRWVQRILEAELETGVSQPLWTTVVHQMLEMTQR